MIALSPYGARVVQRLNFIGTWLAPLICGRNFLICYAQYKRSKGKIHLVNMAQVVVIFLHRILYGIIPLFEITTCAYFPLLVSLWHLAYMLFYVVMFQRLIILEADRYARWIKLVGLLLIAVRFADWPYELIVHQLANNNVGSPSIFTQGTCWAQWEIPVLIVNFVGDALANLFLSGMFVRRLYKHIRSTQSSTPQNQMIEYIAKKSLVCLILTFFVNLAMNLLKVTTFLGQYSDAFTVYFELMESTLLVEALRVDDQLKATIGCSQCNKSSGYGKSSGYAPQNPSQKRSRMPPPFGSFDFVPLEERSTPDPFRNDSPSHSSHLHTSSFGQPPLSDNEKDDPMHIHSSSLDPPPRSPPKNKSKSSMDITSDTNDGFMASPVTFSRQKSNSPPIVNPLASTVSQEQSDMSVPMDTLSRSLVHHPEWNNNDYRMF